MTIEKTISQKIADFTLALKYEDIPKEVVSYAKLLLIDTLGCAEAAIDQPHAKQLFEAVTKKESLPEATLWGTDLKVDLDDAVIYNGSLIHGLDYDDTHALAITHPSSSVAAAGLTIGEYLNKDGKDIITAMIVGYEVLLRLGSYANGGLHDRGFHPTGCISAFSSACIAGKLMGVSHEELCNALGICGSQAASILEFLNDGTDVKKIHPGWAIHSALYALDFAKYGFTGPEKVFEGVQGYFTAHIGRTEGIEEVFSDFGERWYTSEIAFKFYPVCHWLHGFNDILFEMEKDNDFDGTDIETLECIIDERVSAVGYAAPDKLRPATEYHQRFSLFYTIAMAAYKGRLGPREIDSKHMEDQGLLDMIDRVKITVDADAYVPGAFPAQLRVTLKDGREFYGSQPYEVGNKKNPAKRENVLRKYYDNTTDYIGDEKANAIVDSVDAIETVEAMKRIFDNMIR